MFNIFCDKKEHIDESTLVCELFRKDQHPKLQHKVKALEVISDLDGITYSEADNHLTADVSKIPEYQFSRKVSGIHASGGKS